MEGCSSSQKGELRQESHQEKEDGVHGVGAGEDPHLIADSVP
jgi:hypothetical protein